MADHPGMAPRDQWVASDVHKASRYSCAKCGQQFETPHDVYDHLDAKHSQREDGWNDSRD